MKFSDEVTLFVQGGRGGDGVVHFRRGKYQRTGPADGGHGGPGGSVWLEADKNLESLAIYRYNRRHRAEDGGKGGRERCQGAAGKSLFLKVPCGTMAFDAETEEFIGEVLKHGDRLKLVSGGRGGLGNHAFKSSINRSPDQTRPPSEGESKHVHILLKLIADIGFIGFPSAGKSSLLNALTNAKSEVGEHPFTTLTPQLGIWDNGIYTLTLADLPGLIENAHLGKGLGIRFLKHIQRCRAFIWVLNGNSTESPNWQTQLNILREEIQSFDPSLLERPSLVVINKIDMWDEKTQKDHMNLTIPLISVLQPHTLSSVHMWLAKMAELIYKEKNT